MKLQVRPNQKDPKRMIAFVRFPSIRFGHLSIAAYFDKDYPSPSEGDIEIMIVGVLYHKNKAGQFDTQKPPKCFFVRQPTEADTFVRFDGFERTGIQATITSKGRLGSRHAQVLVSPGKLIRNLHIAEHVTGPHNPDNLKPGTGYARYNPENDAWRLEGVSSAKELDI